jgi:hypothetical protein
VHLFHQDEVATHRKKERILLRYLTSLHAIMVRWSPDNTDLGNPGIGELEFAKSTFLPTLITLLLQIGVRYFIKTRKYGRLRRPIYSPFGRAQELLMMTNI